MENLLAKGATGEATSSECAILDQWKEESEENQALYDEYSVLWDMSSNYEPQYFNPDFESALSSHLALIQEENLIQPATQKDTVIKSIGDKSNTSVFSIRRLTSVAALFVLGIAAVFLFENRSTTITSDTGVRFAYLEDGSKIWLDEGSTINYKNGFGTDHRNIELKGKAFFDVNRNENLPFNIQENDLNVSVVGTSFTVDGGNDVVSVTTGKVSVETQSDNVILTKNQETRLSNSRLNTKEVSNNTALWRNTLLSFDDSPLSQVVADINMFHNDKLELERNSINTDCTFTSGGLSLESLDNIIKILKKSYDLEVLFTENGKIILSIVDCI
ncbi:MAG: ferric-dicitrate binding protein FerR (iron transport regulator) [Halioglobus sp.]|jgi:ferric-dicitrate binding protein FerR (iron transport regulator)